MLPNAILGVSLACAHAAAAAQQLPLWRYLDPQGKARMPLPMVNLISGGLHAGGNLDFQDFLLLPLGAGSGYLVGARLASIAPVPGAIAVALAFALHQPGMQGHVSLTFAIGTAAVLSLTSVSSGIVFESLRRSGRLVKREATPRMLRVAGLDP